jgi:molybdopterin-guanine dinucleotide biosynthesis protein A
MAAAITMFRMAEPVLHPNEPVAADQLAAFVLAGGKSSRMGRDKAVLTLNGKTLLQRALSTLRQITHNVSILGSQSIYGDQGAPVLEDIIPECGPLSGIHAALTHSKSAFNLIIAVDTPFLSADFLRFLADRAISSRSVVTTPEIAGYTQPLCAVYSHDFLSIAEESLKAGKYKIVPLFPAGRTQTISEREMAQFAFTPEMFDNLNTPEDLERARLRTFANEP